MKRKTLVLLAALVLIIVGVIGGTLAWLLDVTDPVVNTFTTSDIDITLEETAEEFEMVPGHTIAKDPVVTVLDGSEECYLFVKLEESDNFDDFLSYVMADGWTALDGVSGVYYRKVLTADIGTSYSVLEDDEVSVKSTVTKDMMNALTEETYPTLTITAYASQLYKDNETEFTASEAWGNFNPAP